MQCEKQWTRIPDSDHQDSGIHNGLLRLTHRTNKKSRCGGLWKLRVMNQKATGHTCGFSYSGRSV
jgi:hypothetical protein